MSLLDEALAYAPARPRCSVGLLIESLGAQQRAELVEAIEAHTLTGSRKVYTVQATSLARALVDRHYDIEVDADALQRHRRRDCRCVPD